MEKVNQDNVPFEFTIKDFQRFVTDKTFRIAKLRRKNIEDITHEANQRKNCTSCTAEYPASLSEVTGNRCLSCYGKEVFNINYPNPKL